jgi:hypothetical protein
MAGTHWVNQNKWVASATDKQPHIFDVGRLNSPMWQAYLSGDRYRDRLKRGVEGQRGYEKPAQAEWKSKWVHPNIPERSTARFLNLRYGKEDWKEMKSKTQWISTLSVDSVLKHELAMLRHSKKIKDNILLLNSSFWYTLKAGKFESARNASVWKGRSPDSFDKIYLPLVLDARNDPHWILAVWDFRSNVVEIYDSFHATKSAEQVQPVIHDFLESMDCEKTLPKYVLNKETPTQSDAYNCGFYVIAVTKSMFNHKPLPKKYDYRSPQALMKIGAGRRKLAKKLKSWKTNTFSNFEAEKQASIERKQCKEKLKELMATRPI